LLLCNTESTLRHLSRRIRARSNPEQLGSHATQAERFRRPDSASWPHPWPLAKPSAQLKSRRATQESHCAAVPCQHQSIPRRSKYFDSFSNRPIDHGACERALVIGTMPLRRTGALPDDDSQAPGCGDGQRLCAAERRGQCPGSGEPATTGELNSVPTHPSVSSHKLAGIMNDAPWAQSLLLLFVLRALGRMPWQRIPK
jgi:hypothetical protein